MLPNFLIVGAAKSGTTSLYHYLKQHPEICMSQEKEPHYFVDWPGHGMDLDKYGSLFSGCSGQKAVGEASSGYLFCESAPERIKSLIPGARIIIILREPVAMCFSLWRHMRRIGKRGERLSLKAALDAEPGRMADPDFPNRNKESWHGNFYYFNRALYFGQVERYMTTFGPDKVLVLLFEEFRKQPLDICREIFRFIGVDPDFEPEMGAHNVGNDVWHRGLAKLLTRPSGNTTCLTGAITKHLIRLNTKAAPRLDGELERGLKQRYRPDIEKLARLTGKDLSIWY